MKYKSVSILLKENTAFLLPYLIFLCAAGTVLALWPKDQIHLYINAHTAGKADLLFRFLTNLGDGLTVFFIALLFLVYRLGNGLLLGISGILAGLLTQLLKRTVFSDMYRPVKYFQDRLDKLQLIPGVENMSGHTFPSGHSASAFALYFGIALLTENKLLKFALFCLALLVAFSRVYLSQHFLNDIYAGSLLGTGSTLLTWLLLSRARLFREANWMNKSLLPRQHTQ